MLRAITISVIIGTFLIGSYYVVATSYVPPEPQNNLDMMLSELQPDLTYEKFTSLSEDQKLLLVGTMPYDTKKMLLVEVRDRPSFAAESKDLMTGISGTPDRRMVKTTPIS